MVWLEGRCLLGGSERADVLGIVELVCAGYLGVCRVLGGAFPGDLWDKG